MMRNDRGGEPRRGPREPWAPKGAFVEVRDNKIEFALKKLKKIMVRDGIFNDMRDREAFIKPSEKRRRAKAAARKRQAKAKAAREADPVTWKPRPAGANPAHSQQGGN